MATSRVDVSSAGARPEFAGVVSSLSAGGRAAGDADLPSLSADGRFATYRARGIFVRGPLRQPAL